jgi:hypothetical protein
MADISTERRRAVLEKALAAAQAGLAELERLSNSANPNVAADATEKLIAANIARDDVSVLLAFVRNQPAGRLKPISDDALSRLSRLETAIDTRIRNNEILNGGLSAAAQAIRTAQDVSQILREG